MAARSNEPVNAATDLSANLTTPGPGGDADVGMVPRHVVLETGGIGYSMSKVFKLRRPLENRGFRDVHAPFGSRLPHSSAR